MPNPFQIAGSTGKKQNRYAPLFTNRFFQGLWTQRSPLRDAGSSRIEEKFYGTRGDAMIDGQNVEISNRLTPIRRPGASSYNSQTFSSVDFFYEFRLFSANSETIKIMADQADGLYDATGPSTKTRIFAKSPGAGQSFMQYVANVLYVGDQVDQFKWVPNASGSPVWNFGLAYPTSPLTVAVNGSSGSWVANTYYANTTDQLIIDSNGNLQQVTTGGKSAGSAPTWATSVGVTTTDGTVTWTMLQTAASMVWHAATTYTAGHYLVANAAGVNCLFKLAPDAQPYQVGSITLKTMGIPSSYHGVIQGAYPWTTFTQTQTIQCTHLCNLGLFNWAPGITTNVACDSMDGAGNPTGTQTDLNISTGYQNWQGSLVGTIHIPVAGQYTFQIEHDDEMFMAFDPALSQRITGNLTDPWWNHTRTLIAGYTNPFGYNLEGHQTDSATWNFPVAGDVGFEIDYSNYAHSAILSVLVNGFRMAVGTSISEAIAPIWPTWSDTAVTHPSVQESQGRYKWVNYGPVADFVWHANVNFLSGNGYITDSHAYTEAPFRTGVSGTTTQPSWASLFNALTSDNPNLKWINQGPAAAPPVGSLSVVNGGWSYAYAFVNSVTDTVSSASPASAYTGNFLSAAQVKVTGGASADSQTDFVAIFRTKDGGATWFLINGAGSDIYTISYSNWVSNGYSYSDTTLDANLNTLLLGAMAHENDPPATGIINLTYHLNRMWGSVGNVVYFSQAPNVTIGNNVESFPPLNSFTFPSLVKRMIATAIGLIVFTVSDTYLIAGQGTASSPLYGVPYIQGMGLLSYNACDVQGSIIYLFTTDRQFVSLDPSSGISQLGLPIGDVLQVFDPTQVYVSSHISGSTDHAVYVSDGSTGWYRLSPTAAPEAGFTWSPKANIVGGCKAVQSIEITPGVHRLLIGPTSTGPILKRDLSVNADNGTSYPCDATFGSFVLAQPGQLAELSFVTLDSMALGTPPIIAVLLDEISGDFASLPRHSEDPPGFPDSESTFANRFYFSQSRVPAKCRHMQVKVIWETEDAANELLTFTIFGSHYQEA